MKTRHLAIACVAAALAGCAGMVGLGGKAAIVGLRVNHLVAPANVQAMQIGRASCRERV